MSAWMWRAAALIVAVLVHGASGALIASMNRSDPTLAAWILIWLPAAVLYVASAFVLLLAPLSVVGWLMRSRRSS